MRSKQDSLPQAEALAREYGMFQAGSTVLLAVSGGRDSMTLLHWAWSQAETFGVHLAVGHYHHGMRGSAADQDERRVSAWCREHGIPFYAEHGDVYGEAARRSRGVEETGRDLRYAFLEALAQRLGAAVIATAHNADDNAETLLLHLVRGTGLQGLTGIPPRRGNLVRPLLTTTRAQIDCYAAYHAIPYGDDVTNEDDSYARNRVRHQVTPVLQSLNPRYIENASDSIRLLRADNDCLNAQAARLSMAARPCEGGLVLEASLLTVHPFPIASRAVRQLLLRLTGQTSFRQAHLQAVLDLASSPNPSGRVSLPYGVTVRRMYHDLLLTSRPASPSPPPASLHAGDNPWGSWIITVTGPAHSLTARPRQTGDRLRLPRQARKSLKKLFIEKKIPQAERDSLPVVADRDGVLAVAGLGENSDHPLFGVTQVIFTLKTEKE